MATTILGSIAARSLAALALIGASVALAGCAPTAPQNTETSAPEEVETDAFAIAVGDCLNDMGEGEVTTIPKVDCDEPHETEVYGSSTISDGDFPGNDAIVAQADVDCTELFANYVGAAAEDSKYSIGYYFPTEESWENGDREILCYVFDEAGRITGSVMGVAE
ncbi:hypothetical protein M2152_000671 [Microbacteriaceae bacterium SG_E_30_P1]|uniref:Septum formation-related domain-containing protein n=1 Tax=Antiquaquibacter oligotrophicus TaxID=2880260 RepID=A0ABT6KMU4_9MICO|nr:septum formation family protein [Antiquaquibacter oligotrophicus]MDH6180489.1 hypothetical protein [Antiquaquibacter oligotrophicus]UDF13775.1 septum formation family protein [Antiquaquibacter oligotrophicus]